MYRYRVEMKIDLPNGNYHFPETEVDFPKCIYGYSSDDVTARQIWRKAAMELGEDPNGIDFDHSNTTLRNIGEVIQEEPSPQKKKEPPKRREEPKVQSTPKIKYSRCDYCGDKYVDKDGVYQHLRKNGRYRRYDYCSSDCGNTHEREGGYTRVNSGGRTKQEEKKKWDDYYKRVALERKQNRAEANKYLNDINLLLGLGAANAIHALNRLYNNEVLSEKEFLMLYGKVKSTVPLLKRGNLPAPISEHRRYRHKFTKSINEKFFDDSVSFIGKNWKGILLVAALGFIGFSYLKDSFVGSGSVEKSIQEEIYEDDLYSEDVYEYEEYESDEYYEDNGAYEDFESYEEDWVEEGDIIEDVYEQRVEEASQHLYQDWLDEGYSEEEIQMMIEEGYIESRSVLK